MFLLWQVFPLLSSTSRRLVVVCCVVHRWIRRFWVRAQCNICQHNHRHFWPTCACYSTLGIVNWLLWLLFPTFANRHRVLPSGQYWSQTCGRCVGKKGNYNAALLPSTCIGIPYIRMTHLCKDVNTKTIQKTPPNVRTLNKQKNARGAPNVVAHSSTGIFFLFIYL